MRKSVRRVQDEVDHKLLAYSKVVLGATSHKGDEESGMSNILHLHPHTIDDIQSSLCAPQLDKDQRVLIVDTIVPRELANVKARTRDVAGMNMKAVPRAATM